MQWDEFLERFPNENSCKDEWRKCREKYGVICPNCGSRQHYWKADKECFECKNCNYRQSLTANTIMHGSQLPIRHWFIAMQKLIETNLKVSATEIQKLTNHKNYNPILLMVNRLRNILAKNQSTFGLSGAVDVLHEIFTNDKIDDNTNNHNGIDVDNDVTVDAETIVTEPHTGTNGSLAKPTVKKKLKPFNEAKK